MGHKKNSVREAATFTLIKNIKHIPPKPRNQPKSAAYRGWKVECKNLCYDAFVESLHIGGELGRIMVVSAIVLAMGYQATQ